MQHASCWAALQEQDTDPEEEGGKEEAHLPTRRSSRAVTKPKTFADEFIGPDAEALTHAGASPKGDPHLTSSCINDLAPHLFACMMPEMFREPFTCPEGWRAQGLHMVLSLMMHDVRLCSAPCATHHWARNL